MTEGLRRIVVLFLLIVMLIVIYALHGWHGVGYMTIAYCAILINGLTRDDD